MVSRREGAAPADVAAGVAVDDLIEETPVADQGAEDGDAARVVESQPVETKPVEVAAAADAETDNG
jgi:hypothetical protein